MPRPIIPTLTNPSVFAEVPAASFLDLIGPALVAVNDAIDWLIARPGTPAFVPRVPILPTTPKRNVKRQLYAALVNAWLDQADAAFVVLNAATGWLNNQLPPTELHATTVAALPPRNVLPEAYSVGVNATFDQLANVLAQWNTATAWMDSFNQSLIAPVLGLAVAGNVYPPELDAALDGAVIVGDVLRVQASLGSGFEALLFDVPHVITGAEADANEALIANLAAVSSPAQTFFRARIERGGQFGPWSNTIKHGDIIAPVITSSAAPSYPERAVLAHLLTANEQVTWSIFGGADVGLVEISGATLRLSGNALLDFEAKANYAITVRATDLAGLTADQALNIGVIDADEVPDPIVFTPIANAARSSAITSNTVAVAGLGAGVALPVTVTGGTWSKNGGAFGAGAGTVGNTDTVAVRLTSSASYSTLATASLSVGGFVSPYNVTTMDDPADVQWLPNLNPPAVVENGNVGNPAAVFPAITFAAGTAVVLIAFAGGGNVLSAVTVGGTAATIYTTTGLTRAAIAVVPGISAGSHNVVVTVNDFSLAHCAISTGTTNGIVTASAAVPFGYLNDPQTTGPLTVPEHGISLAALASDLASGVAVWAAPAQAGAAKAGSAISLHTASRRSSGPLAASGFAFQGSAMAGIVLGPAT